ncbi:MAG: hypothetical protein AAB416_03815, partial [Patescibacteria group bacterium]
PQVVEQGDQGDQTAGMGQADPVFLHTAPQLSLPVVVCPHVGSGAPQLNTLHADGGVYRVGRARLGDT